MRGFIFRALVVYSIAGATGCFLTNNTNRIGTSTPKTATHAYWQKVGEIFARKATSGDMKALVQLVREQTDALKELSPEGVDGDLVAAVDEVIRCEEEVLWRAEMAGNDAEMMRRSQEIAKMFADANRKASGAKQKVKGMRKLLDERYGGGFTPMVDEKLPPRR